MSLPLVYLDNNATTRPAPEVLAAMQPCLSELYANPASPHRFGSRAAAAVEEARSRVAALLGARESEIVFTSGGTESNNAALRGVFAAQPHRRHLVVSTVEHHALLAPAELLERRGVSVTRIGVDRQGRLDLDALADALRDDTLLVSIMLANNETGVIFPLAEVCRIAHARGALVHTDAVSAIGKIPVNVAELGVDLLSASAHKLHGPKGVGALYIRRGTPFCPLLVGGPHENQRRAGTLNVPGIVGFGAACALAADSAGANEQVRRLRDHFERELARRVGDVQIVAADAPRLPNTSCVCFAGLSAEAILLLLSEAGVCVSSGSACSSGSLEPSHVLRAMGLDPHVAQGQIRFSFGRYNTADEVERVLALLPEIVAEVAESKI